MRVLFADTVASAHASANLYSLVESAKTNGIEPYRYLVKLFAKLPQAAAADDYAALPDKTVDAFQGALSRETRPSTR